MKYLIFLTALILSTNLCSQSNFLFGVGFDVGNKVIGPNMEFYSFKRLRNEVGLNWNPNNVYSNFFGVKTSIFNLESKNNLWIGFDYEYGFRNRVTAVQDEIPYRYSINNLSSFKPSLSYSRKIKTDLKKRENRFLLLEFGLHYKILTNKINLQADPSNYNQSDKTENRLKKSLGNGLGFYLSFTFFILGGK